MSPSRLCLPTLLLILIAINTSSALNILVLGTVQTRSHFTYVNSITTALLEKGHRIYEITTLPPKPHPNRTSFIIKDGITTRENDLASQSVRNPIPSLKTTAEWSVKQCGLALQSQAAVDLLALARSDKRPHIDVVVHDYVFHQCLGGFVAEFGNPPVVATTAYGNTIEIDDLVGGPMFPSFVPHDITPYPSNQPMTWIQRFYNKIIYLWAEILRSYYVIPEMDVLAKSFFGQNVTSISDYKKHVAVALTNSHPAFHGARPQLPAVIEIGGIHVRPPQTLPDGDLKKFLDSAKDGFILMSFGSVIKTSAIEPWRRKELMRAFTRLSPRRVLLKWEKPWDSEADGPVPDNVFLSPWFPQTDVLGHPNIRVFVTHCGGLSTNEIIRRAVPVVAVPIFMDQHINANHLLGMNIGLILNFADLREETFYQTVMTILDDERYLTRSRQLSALVSDEITTPQERVVFWVEYVARHGGASHLHSPSRQLPWVSRWMIDDLFIFIVVFGILLYIVCGCCKRRSRSGEIKRKRE